MRVRVQREPAELLAVLDQAQERLGPDFDLRDLLWEIFTDLQLRMDEFAKYAEDERIIDLIDEYLVDNYGDKD